MSYDLNYQDEGDRRHIYLRGDINEDFDAQELRKVITDNVIINLEEVRSISSCGIREWISLVSELPESVNLEFKRCSIPITRQFGMLSNFGGPGRVSSFFAPYYCDECDTETEQLIDVGGRVQSPQEFVEVERKCATCGAPLEFDGVEEVYFSFLRDMASDR